MYVMFVVMLFVWCVVFFFFFFFFKQKTAYEIGQWLEFRRVLFRSVHHSMVLGGKIKLIIYINVKSGINSFKQDGGTQEWSQNSNFRFKNPYTNMILFSPVLWYNISFTFWVGSEEHTSELQSLTNLVCRLLLEKKKKKINKKNKRKKQYEK